MKKFLSCMLVFALLLFPLSACKKDNGLTKIRLNEVTHSIFYAPLYLAMGSGYFKDEGLEITLTNGGGADSTMTAVLSGSADIGFAGPEAAIYVYLAGKSNYPVVFGQLTKRDGSFLIGRTDNNDFKWSDLEGKEIIAGRRGGVPAMTLEYVLNQNGLINGENITLNYDIAFNNTLAAFEGGLADYCTLFEPTASNAEKAGKGYVIESIGKASGEVPYTAFFANKSYVKNNEKTLKKFLKAIYRAIDFIAKNSSEKVAEKILPYFDGSELSDITASVESYKNIDAWQTNMSMKEDAFNRLQDIMQNAGELDSRANYSDLIFNDYAQDVYEEVFV